MKRCLTGLSGLVMAAFVAGTVCAGDEPRGEGEGQGAKGRNGMGEGRHQRMRDGSGMLESMDKDKDGKVTLEEFTEAHLARMKEMFEKLDVNKDGVISKEDREARMAEKKAQEGEKDSEGGEKTE